MSRPTIACLVLGMLVHCGEEESCLEINVSVENHEVPAGIDRLHIELSDADGVFVERTYELEPGVPPSLTLCRGSRSPRKLTLVVYGVLGESLVTQSDPVEVVFKPGTKNVSVALP
ncbi:hypothetical protein ACFL6C_00670 [Myxococcota bacterium]